MTREMQEIQQAMSVCWWLPDILDMARPSSHHERAIVKLYEHVLPDLRSRLWPPAEYEVTKAWPNGRGIVVFYRRWWDNIHKAAAANEFPRWRRASRYLVEPAGWPGGAVAAFHVRAGDLRLPAGKQPSTSVVAGRTQYTHTCL